MGVWPPRSTWGGGLGGGRCRAKGLRAGRGFWGVFSQVRGKGCVGELVLGLTPFCSKREEDE